MEPIVLRTDNSTRFTTAAPVSEPVGDVVSYTSLALCQSLPEEGVSVGIWECTKGVWRRQVLKREFSHFLEGHGFFTPDGQSTIEFRAGDTVYFPANCAGTWDIRERVRKTYLILD